ncbi:hypothetical protein B0H63DRAFT_510705 [Podospora didyma]|uniref:CHAT domain-containing protein n=1 Tax=Podospora didyma TaxID=330526 RepID=A0AAE0U080_9PEZI|nr:hypothetical protein B0H63DRAFT_510705 [Podospora didyma]
MSLLTNQQRILDIRAEAHPLSIPGLGPRSSRSQQWQATTALDGEPLQSRPAPLSDPFDAKDQAECQWYFDQFVEHNPFEVHRAATVDESLTEYASSLFSQLGLESIAPRLLRETGTGGATTLLINVSDESEGDRSVHALHWELLEDPALWETMPNLTVIVRRVIAPRHDKTTVRISALTQLRALKTVNILLVVARKLDDAIRDIEPLGYRAIRRVKRLMQQQEISSVQLNVEVVRPGTFHAFESHLSARPIGFFRLVHFDLHGEITAGKDGIVQASLLFASARPPRRRKKCLESVTADRVGQLLVERGVGAAVLNACRSASDHAGQQANLAYALCRAGVGKVLGMSYLLRGTAARLLVEAFYASLLGGHITSFSASVRNARDALRRQPQRQARFGVTRELQDWMIPVVYMAAGVQGETGIQEYQLPVDGSRIHQQPQIPIQIDNIDGATLIGREFDLLRLERLVYGVSAASELPQGFHIVSGHAGVGKTAFLRHATEYWRETGLIDCVLWVDCFVLGESVTEKEEFMTEEKKFSQQLVASIVSALGIKSGDDGMELDTAVEMLLASRTAVILDEFGIGFAEAEFAFRNKGSLSAECRDIITNLMRALRQAQENGAFLPLFLVARSVQGLSASSDFVHFELAALDSPAALELAYNVLGQLGVDVGVWTPDEKDTLDQLIDLLGRNPLAIDNILSRLHESKIPWIEAYKTVLCKRLPSQTPISNPSPQPDDSSAFISRDLGLLFTLPRELVWPLAAISLFWHQGCRFQTLVEHASSSQGNLDSSKVTSAVQLATGAGFFSVDDMGYIDDIHPLFTIHGRDILLDLLCAAAIEEANFEIARSLVDSEFFAAIEVTSELLPSFSDGSFNKCPVHVPEGTNSGRDKVKTVLEGLIRCFITGFCERMVDLDIAQAIAWHSSNEVEPFFHRSYHNVLFCLKICGSQTTSLIPAAGWPLPTLSRRLTEYMYICPSHQITSLWASYSRVVHAFLEQNGSYTVPPAFQDNFLSIMLHLWRVRTKRLARHQSEEADLAYFGLLRRVVDSTESIYGTSSATRETRAEMKEHVDVLLAHLRGNPAGSSSSKYEEFRNINEPVEPSSTARSPAHSTTTAEEPSQTLALWQRATQVNINLSERARVLFPHRPDANETIREWVEGKEAMVDISDSNELVSQVLRDLAMMGGQSPSGVHSGLSAAVEKMSRAAIGVNQALLEGFRAGVPRQAQLEMDAWARSLSLAAGQSASSMGESLEKLDVWRGRGRIDQVMLQHEELAQIALRAGEHEEAISHLGHVLNLLMESGLDTAHAERRIDGLRKLVRFKELWVESQAANMEGDPKRELSSYRALLELAKELGLPASNREAAKVGIRLAEGKLASLGNRQPPAVSVAQRRHNRRIIEARHGALFSSQNSQNLGEAVVGMDGLRERVEALSGGGLKPPRAAFDHVIADFDTIIADSSPEAAALHVKDQNVFRFRRDMLYPHGTDQLAEDIDTIKAATLALAQVRLYRPGETGSARDFYPEDLVEFDKAFSGLVYESMVDDVARLAAAGSIAEAVVLIDIILALAEEGRFDTVFGQVEHQYLEQLLRGVLRLFQLSLPIKEIVATSGQDVAEIKESQEGRRLPDLKEKEEQDVAALAEINDLCRTIPILGRELLSAKAKAEMLKAVKRAVDINSSREGTDKQVGGEEPEANQLLMDTGFVEEFERALGLKASLPPPLGRLEGIISSMRIVVYVTIVSMSIIVFPLLNSYFQLPTFLTSKKDWWWAIIA